MHQELAIELYTPPLNEASVIVAPKIPSDFVVTQPFWIAVTHNMLEDTLETPLIVAHIEERHWK